MGKASSAKKVARAARAGGRSSGAQRRNLAFPAAIALIVVLGVGLVAVAADDRKSDTMVPPVAMQDHWHAAYGIYVCDEFQPPIPEFEADSGIHSHGDGVIHIHPYTAAGAGDNATIGTFLEETDVELTDDELRIGDESWVEGTDTCGDEDAELVVAQWSGVQSNKGEPAILSAGFEDIRFREDGEGYTIAFVPEGTTDIPRPETADNLAELGAIDTGALPGPDSPDTTDVTLAPPGDDQSTTTTAGEPGSTTTGG